MEYQVLEWLNLFFRWFHVVAGIAWIGASFYFVWLDSSLESPPQWKAEQGIKGDLWAFHGGGIYEVAKYELAPPKMPGTLHWFKWEAYTTWLTGTALLILFYYLKADLYLVDQSGWIKTAPLSIAASIGFLISGVACYELLFRLFAPAKKISFALTLCCYIALASYVSTMLFSDRAAYLHVGAMIATIMAANVFLGIIPAQKSFITAIESGNSPIQSHMDLAKLRSVHNNYLTLPVLFCMVSNHYAFLYGHPFNWAILIYVMAVLGYVRHYFNLKNSGTNKPIILIIATALICMLVVALPLTNSQTYPQTDDQSSLSQTPEQIALSIVQQRCTGCHSQQPTLMGFAAPPAGIVLENIEAIKNSKTTIATSVSSKYMPLGNVTQMTDEERSQLLQAINILD